MVNYKQEKNGSFIIEFISLAKSALKTLMYHCRLLLSSSTSSLLSRAKIPNQAVCTHVVVYIPTYKPQSQQLQQQLLQQHIKLTFAQYLCSFEQQSFLW
jgi:hypothetical protein